MTLVVKLRDDGVVSLGVVIRIDEFFNIETSLGDKLGLSTVSTDN